MLKKSQMESSLNIETTHLSGLDDDIRPKDVKKHRKLKTQL